MKFNERLKKLRTDRSLSHEDIAELLGMRRQSYAYLESKVDDKKAETIIKLASFYNVSTDYLLGVSDFPQPFSNEEQKLLNDIVDDDLKEWITTELNNFSKEDLQKLRVLWDLMNK
ncbi:helix-turn-helix domain-containing protein [Viridibacillus sp. NPDC093762]|uniref:helix-turn-helix domain-containing protein n=1 Tax=Viridibacillus sp. NPDC093762 TaxID=3390720 RepID=UPI003D047911